MSDNIIEIAKKELESNLVAYAEFVLDFNKDLNNIYCFYEGKDDRSYYSFRIKSHNSKYTLYNYTCNGKGNVINLHKTINNHKVYANSTTLYFVDKDYEVNNLDSKIYVTPFYSIENFYVIDEAFENILVNEFKIPKSCESYKQAIELYRNCKEVFHSNIIILNAWLSCQNDYRKENNLNTRLNIEDTLKKFFNFDIFEKIVNTDLKTITFPEELKTQEKIETIFSESPKIATENFNKKLDLFKTVNQSETFRGKFELKFLISFLNKLQDEIGKRKGSIFSKRHSCSLRFEYATSISQLSNNAVNCEQLVKYLNTFTKEIVA
ncbi:DUF4435 domain-containing protein [Flavobacterium sp. YO64]|uniref:DUF4435 domain-containing protein n=1 Tax=Flavobacterium sp. YO64 TaxID=394559 RepID=UPI00100C084A|nr:DUF4435 domain-containing protein [Flavobacterium sp. YO64]RXM41534.1 hypothetical protein BOW57_20730 [Flavobacterium sp. YO64]